MNYKLKINLITYSRTKNYGGILQAYGLYRYLESREHDVTFIDYIPCRCNISNKKVFIDETTSKSKIWGKNLITKWLFSIIKYPEIKRSFQPFLNFMDTNVSFTKPYNTIEELNADIPVADVYITGSDQVWNSQFSANQNVDLPFYLPFVKNGKRISYASSFGRDYIPEKDKIQIRDLIGKYDLVSVREKSGQDILNDLGIQSDVVVDPTILCPVKEWNSIATKQLENNYILLYQVSFNKQIYNLAKSIAIKSKKKLIIISLDSKDKKNIKEGLKITPKVEDWLSYIKYADGVITDSFHATIFSILFKRQFIVNSATRQAMSTRIDNLLSCVYLQSRIINSFEVDNAFNVMNQSIDWKKCDDNIDILRVKSEKWLNNALEK